MKSLTNYSNENYNKSFHLTVVGNKPTSINIISALRIKSFITTFLIIYIPDLDFAYTKIQS
jgi:hypothetical protein